MSDSNFTNELREFWRRTTLEAARDECVTVPIAPEIYQDDRQDAYLADILSLIPDPFYLQVALDYGCGIGRVTRSLARRGSYVHAVDVVPEMLEYCKQYVAEYMPQVTLHLTDGWGCPAVPTESCDLAVTLYCLQHSPTRAMQLAIIKDCWRVLRPEGYLLMQTTDHGNDEPGDHVQMLGARITATDAIEMVKQGGFQYCCQRAFEPEQTITLARKVVKCQP